MATLLRRRPWERGADALEGNSSILPAEVRAQERTSMSEARLEIVVLTKDVAGLDLALARQFPEVSILPFVEASEALPRTGSARAIFALAQAFTPALIAAAPRLEWIQALTTGVDPLMTLNLPERVLVTSARGIHGPQMSEMAFAHMLALSRQMPRMVRNQAAKVWERWPQRLLYGKTAVIVGVGAISEELAVRCKAFGMTTVGVSDSRSEGRGFDRIRPRCDLAMLATTADFLIVLAAYTPDTHHLIDAAVLDALSPQSFLLNLARGPVVDEAALIYRLKRKRLAGAGLDVFNVEPLPTESELWEQDNVFLTPHLGGMSDCYRDQLLPLLVHNLRFFANGRIDQMKNRVWISAAGAIA
jgi:D-2-hydroxyacid dehydrogenase (NADP+)